MICNPHVFIFYKISNSKHYLKKSSLVSNHYNFACEEEVPSSLGCLPVFGHCGLGMVDYRNVFCTTMITTETKFCTGLFDCIISTTT